MTGLTAPGVEAIVSVEPVIGTPLSYDGRGSLLLYVGTAARPANAEWTIWVEVLREHVADPRFHGCAHLNTAAELVRIRFRDAAHVDLAE